MQNSQNSTYAELVNLIEIEGLIPSLAAMLLVKNQSFVKDILININSKVYSVCRIKSSNCNFNNCKPVLGYT